VADSVASVSTVFALAEEVEQLDAPRARDGEAEASELCVERIVQVTATHALDSIFQ
jgi:hypothetical protein